MNQPIIGLSMALATITANLAPTRKPSALDQLADTLSRVKTEEERDQVIEEYNRFTGQPVEPCEHCHLGWRTPRVDEDWNGVGQVPCCHCEERGVVRKADDERQLELRPCPTS